jgi:tetratricopeptide (TPR) repeat protein
MQIGYSCKLTGRRLYPIPRLEAVKRGRQNETQRPSAYSDMPHRIGLALILALAAFAAHARSLSGGFTNFDDPTYVTQNPHVLSGLTPINAWWALATFHAANWHPLTWLSLQLDAQLWNSRPIGFHITNLFLHLANTVLLFVILCRMVDAPIANAFIAGLFTLHPLHVESVAWITERKDLVNTFFGLCSIWSYISYAKQPSAWHYSAVFLALVCSLMAKPMFVTLPFVFLLLDYWPLERLSQKGWPALVREKLPLLALSVLSCAVTLAAQRQSEAIVSIDLVPWGARISNAIHAYVFYLGKTFWPLDLAAIYPRAALPSAETIFDLSCLALITGTTWIFRRTRPYLLVGWLWYLGTLVPVIGLVQVGNQAVADRYTYFPQIGLGLMVVGLVRDLVRGSMEIAASAVTAALLLLTACGILTWYQTGYWHDSITLWSHTIAVTTGNYQAHNNLGEALAAQAGAYADPPTASHPRTELLRQAIAQYDEALRIRPTLWLTRYNRGVAYAQAGNLTQAASDFAAALDGNPEFASAHYNLALALVQLGRPDAVEHMLAALKSNSDPAWFSTAARFAWTLAADPNPERRNGALALSLAEGLNQLTGSNQPHMLDILAAAQAGTGDFSRAVETAKRAIALSESAAERAQLTDKLRLYESKRPFRAKSRAR